MPVLLKCKRCHGVHVWLVTLHGTAEGLAASGLEKIITCNSIVMNNIFSIVLIEFSY